jgi:hypothetical protein
MKDYQKEMQMQIDILKNTSHGSVSFERLGASTKVLYKTHNAYIWKLYYENFELKSTFYLQKLS